jgi:3-oxoacyl-(acyl-carrier-protein) synthase
MYITHLNSIYSNETTLIDYVPYPQRVHQVSDGGIRVAQGIKILPSEFVEYLLAGSQGATTRSLDILRGIVAARGKTGLILATGGSVWTGYGTTIPLTNKYPKHRMLPLGMTQIYAGQLANKLGGVDYVSTDTTSCISAHSALHHAKLLIDSSRLDRVIVVSSDNGASEEYMHFFGEQGLCLLESDGVDANKFRLGQGANITVVESPTSLKQTKNTPLAKVHDINIVSETHSNPLGIAPTGIGYRKAITSILTPAMVSSINFVKTHSTYSDDNQVECEVVKELLGNMPTVNYKKKIGHTMGPSAAIEMHLAMGDRKGTFLSLGAGMGNVFAAAIVETLDAFTEE